MADFELLKKLTETAGVSGYEQRVSDLIRSEVKNYVDKIEEDALGNLICIKGSGTDPKIMLAAHMDQIGLVVKYIDKEGYIRFIDIGGIDDRELIGSRVTIHTAQKDVFGVISARPPHLDRGTEEEKKPLKAEDMFIDIGVRSKKEVEEAGVGVGDSITWSAGYQELHNNFICSKAFDNRLGVFTLIEAIKRMKSFSGTVYAVFTTQEETGLKGARTSAFKINPDFALVVDTTLAGDLPNIKPTETDIKLEGGPAITFVEAGGRGAVVPQKIREKMITLAKKARVPYQFEVLAAGMSDTTVIQMVREGINCGSIGIPVRNLHSMVEVAHKKDIELTIDYILEIVKQVQIFL